VDASRWFVGIVQRHQKVDDLEPKAGYEA